MIRAVPPAIAAALLLVGCAGPRIPIANVEPVETPDAWRIDAGGPSAAVDADWWRSFGEPRLTELIHEALERNTDLGVAAGRVREARAQERSARASLLPTLTFGAPFYRSRSVNGIGRPVDQSSTIPVASAAYEVDLWGRIEDQVSAARSGYLASDAAREALRLAVTGEVAGAYVTLLSLDLKLAITRQTLEARRHELDLAQSRARSGYSSSMELAQARSEYQATLQIIPQLEDAVSHQESALSLLLGRAPGPIRRDRPLESVARPAIPSELPSELLRRRPDVAAAEFRLAATDASLAAARKDFLPHLNLAASGGAAISDVITPNPIGLWSIGGSVLAPIFEGGRLKAQAEAAAGRRDQAAFAYRKTALSAFREVDDALSSVRRADRQVVDLQAQRDALSDQLRFATNRFREGYSSYLEQLDAQRGLLSARLALSQAEADALTSRIAVFLAMGGGWSGSSESVSGRP